MTILCTQPCIKRLAKMVSVSALTCLVMGNAFAMLPVPNDTNEMRNPALVNSIQNTAFKQQVNAYLVQANAMGEESLVPIDSVIQLQPNDVIEYKIYLTNHSPERIKSATVTLDIPTEVELIGEVSPDLAQGSVDKKVFAIMPLKSRQNGELQIIPLKYYKALRWQLSDIDLNETRALKYRVKVK